MTVEVTMLSPPVVTAGQDTGQQQVASFRYTRGSIGDYLATIDWGDGTYSRGLVTVDSLSGQAIILGEHTYASPGPETLNVTVEGYEDGGLGSSSWSVAAGDGSGSDYPIPDALSRDMGVIGDTANPGFNAEELKWCLLMRYGGTPWEDLRPYSFTSEDPGRLRHDG